MHKKGKIYCVFVGRVGGLFTTWEECKSKVHEWPNAVYCAFDSEVEARTAYDRFLVEGSWCKENVVTCPFCEISLKASISDCKDTIGQHFYCCWVKDVKMCAHTRLSRFKDEVGSSSSPSTNNPSEMALRCEAVETLLQTAIKERDFYKALAYKFANIKFEDN